MGVWQGFSRGWEMLADLELMALILLLGSLFPEAVYLRRS